MKCFHFSIPALNIICINIITSVSYTHLDVYKRQLDYWMDMAKRVEDMGADSLCIKDMAGLLVPAKAVSYTHL